MSRSEVRWLKATVETDGRTWPIAVGFQRLQLRGSAVRRVAWRGRSQRQRQSQAHVGVVASLAWSVGLTSILARGVSVVVVVELIGPSVVRTTALTCSSCIWRSSDWQLDWRRKRGVRERHTPEYMYIALRGPSYAAGTWTGWSWFQGSFADNPCEGSRRLSHRYFYAHLPLFRHSQVIRIKWLRKKNKTAFEFDVDIVHGLLNTNGWKLTNMRQNNSLEVCRFV